MTRARKLLERIVANPRDVRAEELFELLRAEGVEVRRFHASSHIGLVRGGVRMTLAVPHDGGPLRLHYVSEALKAFGLAEAAAPVRRARREHRAVELTRAGDGGFVAQVPTMPGCMTHGETRAEALANIEDAKACWVEMGE